MDYIPPNIPKQYKTTNEPNKKKNKTSKARSTLPSSRIARSFPNP